MQIIELICAFVELTHSQQCLFVEDGNEFVSVDRDEHMYSPKNSEDGFDGMRASGSAIIRAVCKLVSNSPAQTPVQTCQVVCIGLCRYLEYVSKQLLDSEQALSHSTCQLTDVLATSEQALSFAHCLQALQPGRVHSSRSMNGYISTVLRTESLLWCLSEVGFVIMKHLRTLRKLNARLKLLDEGYLARSDPCASVKMVLQAYINASAVPPLPSLSKKELMAVNCISSCDPTIVRECIWHMFQAFAVNRTVDIVSGRTLQTVAIFAELLTTAQVHAFCSRCCDLMSASVALAVRLQACASVSKFLHLMAGRPPAGLASHEPDSHLISCILHVATFLGASVNSNTGHIVLDTMSQCLGLLQCQKMTQQLIDQQAVASILRHCVHIWKMCVFDSLCIDAVCDTVYCLAEYTCEQALQLVQASTPQPSDWSAVMSAMDTSNLLLNELLRFLDDSVHADNVALNGTASPSRSIDPVVDVPHGRQERDTSVQILTGIDMLVELIGSVACLVNETTYQCMITSDSHSLIATQLVMFNSVGGVCGGTLQALNRVCGQILSEQKGSSVVKACLGAIKNIISRSNTIAALMSGHFQAQASQVLCATAQLAMQTLRYSQTRGSADCTDPTISADGEGDLYACADWCIPSVGILCQILLFYGSFIHGSAEGCPQLVSSIIAELVSSSQHSSHAHIQYTATMGIVHVFAHCRSGLPSTEFSSIRSGKQSYIITTKTNTLSAGQFAQLVAGTSTYSTNALMQILDMWSALHVSLEGSSYNKRVSLIGLLNLVEMFAEHIHITVTGDSIDSDGSTQFGIKLFKVAIHSFVNDTCIRESGHAARKYSCSGSVNNVKGLVGSLLYIPRSRSGSDLGDAECDRQEYENGEDDDSTEQDEYSNEPADADFDVDGAVDDVCEGFDVDDGDNSYNDEVEDPFTMYQANHRAQGAKSPYIQSGDADSNGSGRGTSLVFVDQNVLFSPCRTDPLYHVDLRSLFRDVLSRRATTNDQGIIPSLNESFVICLCVGVRMLPVWMVSALTQPELAVVYDLLQ
jgi:hypothetical protein